MPATLIDQIRYKGHLYSVPVNIHRANVLWYNPKVLEKATASRTPPKTWAEFIAALDKAQGELVSFPLALGGQWTQLQHHETVMIGALGTERLGQALAEGCRLERRRRPLLRSTASRRCSPTRTPTPLR